MQASILAFTVFLNLTLQTSYSLNAIFALFGSLYQSVHKLVLGHFFSHFFKTSLVGPKLPSATQSWAHPSMRDQTIHKVDLSCFNCCKSIRDPTSPEPKSITSKTQLCRNRASLFLVLFLDNHLLQWKTTLFLLEVFW